MASTSTAIPAAPSSTGGGNSGGSGPTSSPLLFFVALGFGVVFTNLWIIVGVKYCFRYNQRNRAARMAMEGQDPIDMAAMPRPHRRRREKKLMTMDEVNERFPVSKYKAWRAGREHEGLPSAGGISSPPSRAGSLKEAEGVIISTEETRKSIETAEGDMTISPIPPTEEPSTASKAAQGPASAEKQDEKTPVTLEQVATTTSTLPDISKNNGASLEAEDDDDDPINAATPPEMLANPGDTCAICLDTLEDDDDVRGLTCGHAFHGVCIEPWLTSRRACCPLCKADYYVPKPRPEGEQEPAATGRRSAGPFRMNMPQSPQASRGNPFSRGRAVWLSTSRYATPTSPEHNELSARSAGSRDVASLSDRIFGIPARPVPRHAQTHTLPSWRNRLNSLRNAAPFRRNSANGTSGTVGNPTPAQLEAGTR